MRGWGLVAAFCVGAVGLLAAAGCGASSATAADSSPVPITSTAAPSPSVSSPTASPSSTLDPSSDAAILAAVHAYADALTKVAAQVSIVPLQSVTTSDCPCVESETSLVNQLAAKSEHLDVVFSAANARVLRRSSTNADVSVVLSNGPYHLLDAHGQVTQTAKAAALPSTLSLQRKGATWLVFYVR